MILSTRITRISFLLLVVLILAGVFGWGGLWKSYTLLEESVMYNLDPTAARAFEYGERHFNSRAAGAYDVERAEYFFGKAADIDPTYPYLYHELARIAFLKGEFETAMALIDMQIAQMGDNSPNSYYIRALIEGYKGEYAASAKDYEYFLKFYPTNWAAVNDYAWVLLKAGRAQEAKLATARALEWFPDNPWLLNTNATALFETREYAKALKAAQKASVAVAALSEAEWLQAYPGNDPRIANKGITAFKKAVEDNIHSITLALASSTVQSNVKP